MTKTSREEILSTAASLFAMSGYGNTSVRDIADRCGLLAGSLYSHFRSKSEILRLIIEPFYAELLPAMRKGFDTPGTGADRLEAMMTHAVDVLVRFPDEMAILHYGWAEIAQMDDLQTVIDQSNEVLQLWYEALVQGLEDGSVREGIDPEFALRVITSSMYGPLDRKRYGARPESVASRPPDELSSQLVTVIATGLRAPTA